MPQQLCKFHPFHSGCSETSLQPGQRYRSAFNDSRLAARVDKTLEMFSRCRSRRVDDFSLQRKDIVATRRLLANEKVQFGELINYCCDITTQSVCERQVLVLGDGSSFNLSLGGHGARSAWSAKHSSLANSKVPGFQFMAGLVIDQCSHNVIGVSDMLLYDSPRDMRGQEKRITERKARLKLPLHDRESGGWTILADNSMDKLCEAKRVTFVFDREADSYENMTYLRQTTGGEFIIRQKYNRQAINEAGRKDSVLALLGD